MQKVHPQESGHEEKEKRRKREAKRNANRDLHKWVDLVPQRKKDDVEAGGDRQKPEHLARRSTFQPHTRDKHINLESTSGRLESRVLCHLNPSSEQFRAI
jgi:hypothetical protein